MKRVQLLTTVSISTALMSAALTTQVKADEEVHFDTCESAWQAGYGNLKEGQNGYNDQLKKGKDGTACSISDAKKGEYQSKRSDGKPLNEFVINGYGKDQLFYDETGNLANGWYHDGSNRYFFQEGKKYTGNGRDSDGVHYFVNGKYANGTYNNKTYVNGKEVKLQQVYKDGIFYGNDGKPANWWYNDGTAWYYFKEGKKYTGNGRDSDGEHYFINGKYASGYHNGIFYTPDGRLGDFWYDDGTAWYFFQEGKKYTGNGRDSDGKHYFINGKYASGYHNGIFYTPDGRLGDFWYDDGTAWYFFQEGKKYTGNGRDSDGEHYFINGKYASGYHNGIFYTPDGRLGDFWYDDGTAWYFFQEGKKYTGTGRDSDGVHYFVNGKYANGTYNNKTYVNGKEVKLQQVYKDGIFYGNDSKPANWWYNDGTAWYYFKEGKKYTGNGRDSDGEHYFINGKYASGYHNGIFYTPDGRLGDFWYDDGTAWYFFQEGKKYTGTGRDSDGVHYFVNGKYANGTYNNKTYVNGKEVKLQQVYKDGIFYGNDGKPANWWYNDGTAWYYFKEGKKYTGNGRDSDGEHYFINGKYASGYHNGIFYTPDGRLGDFWYDDGTAWYFFKEGKKFTGEARDSSGIHMFVNGKYASNSWVTLNGKRYFYNARQQRIGDETAKKVIDVSEHNGTINWEQVAKDNDIDAVIVRIGYADGFVDKQLANNINQLNRLGIPYGIYLYSYAETEADGQAEAQFTIDTIKKYHIKPSYPIYYDIEDWEYINHSKAAPKDTATWVKIINKYMDIMSKNGYSNVNVYSYRYLLQTRLNNPDILKKVNWVAAYTDALDYANPYYSGKKGWQYTSKGYIKGINTEVDMSVFY